MTAIQEERLTVQKLYNYICQNEGIKSLKLRFSRVGKGGASITHSSKECFSINIDLNRICCGAAYALCHEVAHQILISTTGNARHDRSFKSLCKKLETKYVNCSIARQLIF